MNESYKLYLPNLKKEVKIEVSLPRNNDGIKFDTLYFLDGQNAFKDSHAAFGRSIRATKHLGFAAKELNKRIIGVAIHNAGTDIGRNNEYSPWKIEAKGSRFKNNPKICEAFCKDFVDYIIPFIENKYNVHKDKSHRFIYGSSLAAVTALYLTYKYEAFDVCGAFSTANFLFPSTFYKFLDENINKKRHIFLYVGKDEESDDLFDNKIYLDSSIKLLNYFESKNTNARLVISSKGVHNEESWDKAFIDFISFIYSKNIIYRN